MKKLLPVFILAVVCFAAVAGIFTGAAAAEQIEDVHIHGVSMREGSVLKIAVDSDSLTAYTNISWFIYVPADTLTTHSDGISSEEILLLAGLYKIPMIYEVGRQIITWTIGPEVFTFTLRITDKAMVEEGTQTDNTIRVDPNVLDTIEREVAIGCTLAALASSIFVIPYWKAKKSEGYEDAFDE